MPSRTESLDTAVLHSDLRRVFVSGRTRALSWRLEQLRGIERLCEEGESEIAAALAEDLGRPAVDAWLGDIASTKAEARYARKHVKKWMRTVRQPLPLTQRPGRGWIQYDPLGAVLIIGPWNYPFYLSLAPLVAAVAAGNCAVVKPSELAPATSRVLAQRIPEYLDPNAVRVVEGDAATTQALLGQGFDHALFTGGTEVGKKIMAAAAPTLTPVTLELGGKSPVIVAADADIDVAARRIAWVKLLNSGQTCIAPDYVLAEQTDVKKIRRCRRLTASGGLPADPLVAYMPVSTRLPDAKDRYGNAISSIIAPIPTHLSDPRARLAFTHETLDVAKDRAREAPPTLLNDVNAPIPVPMFGIAARGLMDVVSSRWMRPPVNLIMSNVPGSPVGLACCGAPLLANYAMSVIFDGFALNITVVSYQDGLDIGIVGDAQALPDAWDLMSDIRHELAELSSLVTTERNSH